MRIGVLGFGNIGKVFYKVCSKLGFRVQVYDKEEEKCRGYEYNKDLEKDCEKIIVCLPDELHYEVSKKLIEWKRDVLLVKPATRDVNKLKELYNLAIRNKVVFKVALNNRFRNEIPEVDWDIYEAVWIGDEKNIPSWRDRKDVWWDLGIHLIDLFFFTKKSKHCSGKIVVGYGKGLLNIKWYKKGKVISEILDGIKGIYDDEYTFERCVLDWLRTRETKIDNIFLASIYKVLEKEKNLRIKEFETLRL